MKDYYYFLGIDENASAEDIKKAYRKLSLKYHPDKNDNDEFFVNRFREIQEAYETLMDEDRKRFYDQNFATLQRNRKSTLPPKIRNFSVSKIRVQKGEEVTVYWETYDADLVKIVPFGLEKPNGERRFRITEFDKSGKFQILLHATNTLIHKTVVQGITITELDEREISETKEKPISWNPDFMKKQSEKEKDNDYKIRIIVAVIILIISVILIFFS